MSAKNRNAEQERDQPRVSAITRYSVKVLRGSLALAYIWFGLLKVIGRSPVAQMVYETTPILPKRQLVPLVGGMEIAIGLGLLGRIALPLTLVLMFGHLATTFLSLVRLPHRAFQNKNPLLLTKDGEFVIKNLVLMAGGLVVASTLRHPLERTRDERSDQ